MNWFKTSKLKNPEYLSTEETNSFIKELLKKIPSDFSIKKTEKGWNILDNKNNIIVYNEPTLIYALKEAIERFKFILI